jgi:hypothetical protein
MEGKLSCQGSTDALLSAQSTLSEKYYREACTTEASCHNSTAMASRIAADTSWMKLWDIALDYGPRGTDALQALYDWGTVPARHLPSLWCCNGRFLYTLSQIQSRLSTLFFVLVRTFSCMLNNCVWLAVL